jgi:hypothetical protein
MLKKTSWGFTRDGMPFETLVIPAKAGIQSANSTFPKVCGIDSRFRGNDCESQRPSLASDTSTERWQNNVGRTHPHSRIW